MKNLFLNKKQLKWDYIHKSNYRFFTAVTEFRKKSEFFFHKCDKSINGEITQEFHFY